MWYCYSSCYHIPGVVLKALHAIIRSCRSYKYSSYKTVASELDVTSAMPFFFLFFLHPIYCPRSTLALPPSYNSDPGSHSGPSAPRPTTAVRAFIFYRENNSAFFSLVDYNLAVYVCIVWLILESSCVFQLFPLKFPRG